MNTSNEDKNVVFDRLMRGLGLQRAGEDSLPPALQKMFDGFRANAKLALTRFSKEPAYGDMVDNIHCDIYDDTDFNALASSYLNQDFIGISGGLLIGLPDVFSVLLSDPNVLPHIGDIRLEHGDPSFYGIGFPWLSREFASNPRKYTSYPYRIPKDPVRKQYAEFLYRCATSFIFMHEFGHLIQGHAEYWRNAAGKSELFEFANKYLSPNELPARRVMEILADESGVIYGIQSLLFGLPLYISIDMSNRFSPTELLRSWYFAVSVVFTIWYLLENPNLSEKNRTHPHSLVRLDLVADKGSKVMAGLEPLLDTPISTEQALTDAKSDLREAWKTMKLSSAIALDEMSDEQYIIEKQHLEMDILNLRSKVLQYARIPLLQMLSGMK